jgi:integrase
VAPAATPLDPAGPAHHLSARTRQARIECWGNYLALLESRGWLDPAEAVADRLTFDRLGEYIRFHRDRGAGANGLRRMVLEISLAIGAMVPEQAWGWVRRHPDRPSHAEAAASKKPIKPFDAAVLVDRAMSLCDKGDRAPASHLAARQYRDGLLLALATYIAPRVSNLADIEIGRHLVEHETGFQLRFDAQETKTGVVLDTVIPQSMLPFLRRYLEVHRPRLLSGRDDHGQLWVGAGGRPLAKSAFYGLFMRRSQELCGRRIHPHLVRHAMATELLTEDPRAVRTAAAALTHKGVKSITAHYNHSGRSGAQSEWLRVWDKMVRARKDDPDEDEDNDVD